jgi:PAS domain S-box-containing protein
MKGMKFRFQNAKLVRNGLLIVSVPLFFGVFFVLILSHLLHESEQETDREMHMQKVMASETRLLATFLDAVTQMSSWSMYKHPDMLGNYYQARKDLVESFKNTRELVGNDPTQQETLDRMDLIQKRLFSLIDSIAKSAREGGDFGLVHIAGLRTQLESLLAAYKNEGSALLQREFDRSQAKAPVSTWRLWIQQFIILGGVLNFLLTLSLALFFTKTISQRLLLMRDNMARLASDMPLNRVSRGTDEIATLDQWFHQMAEDLEAAKKTEKQILANMPVGLAIANERGVIELTNSTTEEMFSAQSGALIGEALATLFADRNTDERRGFLKMLSEKAAGRSLEMIARRTNGERFPVEVSVTELDMQGGKRWLATIVDVTQRHEIERLKREFVAMVSHDLRTPLTSLQSTLALINAGALGQLTERGQRMAKRAEGESVRLINLIGDLLFIEKMESGKFDIHLEDVDLSDVLLQSVEAVQKDAQAREVVIETPATEAHVSADPDRLVQVLVNLLSNAIKFSPEKGVVALSVKESEDWVELRVADHGRGIPPEYRDIIFERFAQVEASDSREKGGTGLGLPICKLIVEGHRGRIGVESTNGHGSTFWFRIPKTEDSPACV